MSATKARGKKGPSTIVDDAQIGTGRRRTGPYSRVVARDRNGTALNGEFASTAEERNVR
jgi:hypothetical protein